MADKTYTWNSSENCWVNVLDPNDKVSKEDGIHIVNAGSLEYIGGTISNGNSESRAVSADNTSNNYVVELTISDITLTNNNKSSDCGSAIRTQNPNNLSNHPTIIANNCIISNNTNPDGGAVDNVGGNITLNGCMLIANKTSASGAAITNRHSTCNMTINECIFYGNSASSNGGALYNINGNSSISTSNISNSYFMTASDSIYRADGYINFTGTNYIGADVTGANSEGGNVSSGATIAFINSVATNIDLNFQGNNSIYFCNSAAVDLTHTNNQTTVVETIVIRPEGTVGDTKTLATAATSWNDNTYVYYNGSASAQKIGSISDVSISSGTLTAKVKARGLIMNTTVGNDTVGAYVGKNVNFHSASYSEDIGTVVAGGDKVITGSGTNATSLSGRLYADGNALTMTALKYSGRIYGDNAYAAGASAKATDIKVGTAGNAVKIESNGGTYSRIYGGADITAQNVEMTGTSNINLEINLASGSTVGNVYGGGSLSQTGCTYHLGVVTTTISGDGYYKYYVGNGTQANEGCSVQQGDSTLNISGGTFASFVYAGGYNQSTQGGATAIQCGNTLLRITGGTFLSNVFGGCVAADNVAYAAYTTVAGNCNVTVNTSGSNQVTFGRNVVAGSNGSGDVTGNTKLTFTGLGTNLTFSGASGSFGYILGGCTGDGARAFSVSAVDGTRTLEFSGFTGNFGANVRNSFDTVSFVGSSVTFTGPKEVDLRLVKTWEFDIGDDKVDLTWTSTGCLDAENDFSGDALVISGSVTGEHVLMSGDATTLNGWQAIGSLKIGGVTYTNKGKVDSYVNFGDTFKLSVSGGQLKLASLA